MPKLTCCDSCQYYAHNPHLVCALHPSGQEQGYCADYHQAEQTPNPGLSGFLALFDEPWEPQGATYEGDELVIDRDPVKELVRRQNLLNWHPLFTGRCPECEMPISDPGVPHWDCPECGWIDDSV